MAAGGMVPYPVWHIEYTRFVAAARAQLDEPALVAVDRGPGHVAERGRRLRVLEDAGQAPDSADCTAARCKRCGLLMTSMAQS